MSARKPPATAPAAAATDVQLPVPADPAPPAVGFRVLYRLTTADVADINRRRRDWQESPAARWGYQAHVGNGVHTGDTFPATVVRVNDGDSVNLRVTLDGTDDLWVTSVVPGAEPGCWRF